MASAAEEEREDGGLTSYVLLFQMAHLYHQAGAAKSVPLRPEQPNCSCHSSLRAHRLVCVCNQAPRGAVDRWICDRVRTTGATRPTLSPPSLAFHSYALSPPSANDDAGQTDTFAQAGPLKDALLGAPALLSLATNATLILERWAWLVRHRRHRHLSSFIRPACSAPCHLAIILVSHGRSSGMHGYSLVTGASQRLQQIFLVPLEAVRAVAAAGYIGLHIGMRALSRLFRAVLATRAASRALDRRTTAAAPPQQCSDPSRLVG